MKNTINQSQSWCNKGGTSYLKPLFKKSVEVNVRRHNKRSQEEQEEDEKLEEHGLSL